MILKKNVKLQLILKIIIQIESFNILNNILLYMEHRKTYKQYMVLKPKSLEMKYLMKIDLDFDENKKEIYKTLFFGEISNVMFRHDKILDLYLAPMISNFRTLEHNGLIFFESTDNLSQYKILIWTHKGLYYYTEEELNKIIPLIKELHNLFLKYNIITNDTHFLNFINHFSKDFVHFLHYDYERLKTFVNGFENHIKMVINEWNKGNHDTSNFNYSI